MKSNLSGSLLTAGGSFGDLLDYFPFTGGGLNFRILYIKTRFHSVISLIGDVIKSIIKLIFVWTIKLCRVVIGSVVLKTGVDFAKGSGAFAYRDGDVITGAFVVLIGAYIILSSIFPDLFGQSDSDQSNFSS